VELLYSNQVGQQWTITRFGLISAHGTWMANMNRHWYLDWEGPRPERDPNYNNSPLSGRVTSIVADLKNDPSGNTVYMGAAYGGLWKSTNALNANPVFTPLTDAQPTLSMGALAIDSSTNPPTILAGTGEPNDAIDSYYGLGILRSTDGGTTWTRDQELDTMMTGNNVFKYTNSTGPTNFTINSTGAGTGYTQPSLLAYDPEDSNIIMAGGRDSGVFLSTDAGQNWSLMTNPTGSSLSSKPHLPRPYFAYFGSAAGVSGRGWYSYDLGSWHVVVLNSNCDEVRGCGGDSAQWLWLRQDLAAHPGACTLAYWHAPRFSSGEHGPAKNMADVWRVLYEAGAELVVSGHDHEYERFAPQDPVGTRDDARGVRQFVVGTGGGELRAVGQTAANSEKLITHTYGVLRLDLYPGRFAWSFLSVRGATLDSGSADCH